MLAGDRDSGRNLVLLSGTPDRKQVDLQPREQRGGIQPTRAPLAWSLAIEVVELLIPIEQQHEVLSDPVGGCCDSAHSRQ